MIYDLNKSSYNDFQIGKPSNFPLQPCVFHQVPWNTNLLSVSQAQGTSPAPAPNPSLLRLGSQTLHFACTCERPKDQSTFHRLRTARTRAAVQINVIHTQEFLTHSQALGFRNRNVNLYLRLLQVYSPGHLEICRQAVSTAPNAFQGNYSPTPGQEKISFMDFIFFHLATTIYHSSKRRAELCLPFATASPGKEVWKLGLLFPIHVSETLYSSFYTTVLSYVLFVNQPSSFLPLLFELGLLISCLLLFLSLLLSTHTPMELLSYFTAS